MPLQDDGPSPCIDENAVLDFVQGRLDKAEVARIDEHADGCIACRKAIDVAVRAFRERATGLDHDPITLTRFVAGDRLASRYRIVRFIARGGMGEVYEAEDVVLGTHIAVKTIGAAIADNPQSARRLKQEVTLARRITHPNVCRIFDLGVHDTSRPGTGVLFITMELIQGVSLAQRIKERGRYTAEAALPIVRAMAGALGAAHRAEVVHRDFKSDNVMLAPDEPDHERVVVMDFGLARNISLDTNDSTMGRGLEGTLAYMAPEQLEGQSAREPADIYALGLVMYEMLTGQLPFAPSSGGAWLRAAWQRVVEPIPPVRSFVPEIDPRWNDVIARCLEKDIERRPSADDVVRALLGEALPEPQPAPPAEVVTPPRKVRPRWPWAAGAAIGLMGVLIVAAAVRHRPPPAAAVSVPTAPEPAKVPPPRPLPPPPPPPPSAPPPAVEPAAVPPAPHHASAPRPAHHEPTVASPTVHPDAGVTPAPAPSHRRSADPDDGFIFK
jgi:serine/threonine protein kinase